MSSSRGRPGRSAGIGGIAAIAMGLLVLAVALVMLRDATGLARATAALPVGVAETARADAGEGPGMMQGVAPVDRAAVVPADASEPTLVRLRVVRSEDGAGVPDATVWLLPADAHLETPDEERAGFLDPGLRYRRLGTPVQTDPMGIVEWRAEFGPLVEAFVEQGTRCAEARFNARVVTKKDRTVELVLRPDVTVRIAVRDAHGQAVHGATVEWEVGQRGGEFLWDDDAFVPDGDLVLRHLGLDDDHVPSPDFWLRAYVKLPGGASAESDVTWLTPGEHAICLVTPPMARLELRCVDERGEDLRPMFGVGIELMREGRAAWQARLWPASAAPVLVSVLAGETYSVTLFGFTSHSTWSVPAPSVAGVTETRVLTVDRSIPVLRMRLVDARGQALEHLPVQLQRWVPGGYDRYPMTFSTDAQGAADVLLRPSWLDGASGTVVVVRAPTEDGERSAILDLPESWSGGTRNLGDVVLHASTRLVAGSIAREVEATPDNTCLEIQCRSRNGGWVRSGLSATVRAGRFEVRGPRAVEELRLRAHAQVGSRQSSAWVTCRPGTRDLELRLEPGATVELPVVGIQGANLLVRAFARPVQGEALHTDEIEREAWQTDLVWVDDGKREVLWISGLPRGRYRIEVEFSGLPGMLDRRDVALKGAEGTVQLAPLDLGAFVRPVRIEVLDEGGQPVTSGWVRVVEGKERAPTRSLRHGPVTLWLDRARDIEVRVPETKRVVVRRVAADVSVTVGAR
ncbi:MAG: hypothetical protein AAF628_07875 [Planctomycetota bacterium]